MKPSKKIEELKDYSNCPLQKIGGAKCRTVSGEMQAIINTEAIIQYLDEEWEKKQTPKHKKELCIFKEYCENCI